MKTRTAAILTLLAAGTLFAGCSAKPPPPAPFVSPAPYLGLNCEQLAAASAEIESQRVETAAALVEAQAEDCRVTFGDFLLWGVLAWVANDDAVCRELETEALRLQAIGEAIRVAGAEQGCMLDSR